MSRNWIINGLGILTLISSFIVGGFALNADGIPSYLLLIQFILVIILVVIGRLNPIIKDALKSFFKPSIQLIHLLIIGTLSSFFAPETVAALIPEDPYIFKNALLLSTVISSVFLWLIIINILLTILYLYVGYKIVFSHKDKESSQKVTHYLAIFVGLGIGVAFGYKEFLLLAQDGANTFGSRIIIHSQFHKNKHCKNLTKDMQIASVGNGEVLEFIDNLDNTVDYIRRPCVLIKNTATHEWEETD